MKHAITALGLAIVTATSAAAMVGPYERASQDNPQAYATTGDQRQSAEHQLSSSPEADWNNGEVLHLTVFSTRGLGDAATQLGADQR